MNLVLLVSSLLSGSATSTTPSADSAPKPVDFVCDSMEVQDKPRSLQCSGNVVLRQDNLILCCDRFTGFMDQNSRWTQFHCQDKVRASRNGELMWSREARFIIKESRLTLTGKPILQRGNDILQGQKIVVRTDQDRVNIVKPEGRIRPRNEVVTRQNPQWATSGKLPHRCPLPTKPKL